MSGSGFKPFLRMKGHEFKEGYDKAILAVGSTEYHGEHLPYGTDTLVSEHVSMEVAMKVNGMLMLPPIPYGMSAHYSNFPIAISLSTETLMRVLREVFDSLRKHGLNRLIIVNGHDGNIPALSAWWVTAGQLVPEGTFEVWDGLGHGGEGETSMMLRVDPSLVDMEKAVGVVPDLPEHVDWKWTFDEITPHGVTGDPTKATQEKGAAMNDALVNLLVDLVKELDEKDWKI